MKLRSLNRNYKDWFLSELEEHSCHLGYLGNDKTYHHDCLLFVTVDFNQNAISAKRRKFGITSCDPEMDAFRQLYRSVCSQVDIESGTSGQRERPLVLFAVDYEGSKSCSFQPAGTQNLHVHSIWAMKQDEVAVYAKTLESLRLEMFLKSHCVQMVEAKPFDPTKALSQPIDYVLKAWTKSQLAPSPWLSLGVIRGYEPGFKMPKIERPVMSLRRRIEKERKRYQSAHMPFPWEAAA